MELLEPVYGRILIIEHNPISLKNMIDYLEDNGFILFSAATQEEGLEIFRKEKPDCVLSDAGLDLLDRMNREFPETPVIILSDQNAISNAVNALRLGAWDYILTPITDLIVLERSICKALERTRLIQENHLYRKALEVANETLSHNLKTLERDQEAGRQVQKQLLPLSKLSPGPYEFQYKILPSLYLSGDFVDYFKVSDTLYGFYIADVSGHGASSAFITVMLKSFIAQMQSTPMILEPHLILKKLGDELLKAQLGKYLTMIYGIIDIEKNHLEYSVGGHYPMPILYDGEKGRYLEGEGFAVGIFEEAVYEKYHLKLPERFSLILYSDGILELLPGKNLLENEAILLKKSSDFSLTSETMLEIFGIQEENAAGHLPDDITFLMLKNGNEKTI